MDTKGKVVCIIQARMGSRRLPGKVLMDISGSPMIYWVVSRARRAKLIDDVIVATTIDALDDEIGEWCSQHDVKCFRGDALDVLDRFYQCARTADADTVVRITADCPLIDPSLIDAVLDEYFTKHVDFAANRLPPPYERTYPIGLDVEVVSFSALEKAWREAVEVFEREHVMPYFYSKEGKFKVFILDHKENLGSRRWTVDTPEDLEFMRQLFSHLQEKEKFSWLDVLEIVRINPELEAINAQISHKTYKDVDSRANK